MYKDKGSGYFQNIRKELLELIPQENRMGNLLEIGASSRSILIYAKKNGYAQKIYGVELYKLQKSFQNSKEIKKFIIDDIERLELPFEKNFFDIILCGDVLEHLIYPNNVVKKLRLLLKDNGVLIVSLPNIRQIQILKQIFLEGNFKYSDAGILDRTHLRFCCKKNMIELFENNKFKIDKIISNSNLLGKTTKKINKLTFNLFDEFLAAQYYIVATKKLC